MATESTGQSPPVKGEPKVTVPGIMAAKGKKKLTMLTAYDYSTALWVDRAGVDMILVGDSLAMVMLGHEDTLSVTMEEMLHHDEGCGSRRAAGLVIGDMPFCLPGERSA